MTFADTEHYRRLLKVYGILPENDVMSMRRFIMRHYPQYLEVQRTHDTLIAKCECIMIEEDGYTRSDVTGAPSPHP